MNPKQKLIEVLRETRVFLARPGNDFVWSSWPDAAAALPEIDRLISRISSDDFPSRDEITFPFLPTGSIQEASVSSGWGQEFLEISSRLDVVVEAVYGA